MAAGKHSSSEVTVQFDIAAGTLTAMTPYITEIGGIDVEALMEESTAFGDTAQKFLPSGILKAGQITLGGYYDDTAATGPDVVFNAPAPTPSTASRTLTITFATGKTFTVETYIVKYTRTLTRNALTKFTVTLQPTGIITEA